MKYLRFNSFLLSGIFLLGFSLQNCNPDPPDPPPKDLGFLGLGEAKDYVYFKKGTWWVYKNTRTGLYDTIEVYFNLLDTLAEKSDKWRFTNELFSVKSKSLTTGHFYNFYQRSAAVDVLTEPTGFITPNLARREPFEGDIIPFYYPFVKPHYGYNFCVNIKDTMNINGQVYPDVAVFYIKQDALEPDPLNGKPAKYYWARHYGLVQKDLFDSQFYGDTGTLFHSWKIVNSNIIQ